MGRMWDALRRDAGVASESEPSCALPPIEDAAPMFVEEEEIPFIEVGPRKSMEASPSVLAYERKKEQGERTIHEAPSAPSQPPIPRRLPFRAVFVAAADAEDDTPLKDA
jgi:hypothetical protein